MPRDINSPFTPGQPVPVEFFVGRLDEIRRLTRKVGSASRGVLEVEFIVGERGIGKSSLASFTRFLADRDYQFVGLHTFLGGVTTLEEMVRRIFDRLLKESTKTAWSEKVKQLFGDHIRQVELFGISVEFDAAKKHLRPLVDSFAPALRSLVDRLKDDKKGVLLILDDINGLAQTTDFANWLKSLVDEVATSGQPLPLCLALVGIEERRQKLIELNASLARVFDLVHIAAWSREETRAFYDSAFSSVGTQVEGPAMERMVLYAGGLPVLAHEIGDAAFALDEDGNISLQDAMKAVSAAAEIVGNKHLQPRVFKAIRSPRYRSILRKLARMELGYLFQRGQLKESLSTEEKDVLDKFLRRMRDIGVIVSHEEGGPGAYRFTNLLHYLYFWMEAERARNSREQ